MGFSRVRTGKLRSPGKVFLTLPQIAHVPLAESQIPELHEKVTGEAKPKRCVDTFAGVIKPVFHDRMSVPSLDCKEAPQRVTYLI